MRHTAKRSRPTSMTNTGGTHAPMNPASPSSYSCGIDLGMRTCHICVIDDSNAILVDEPMSTDLTRIRTLLGPFKPSIRIAVESTTNAYWLIDGLQEDEFDVCLVHAARFAQMLKGQRKTDRRDARSLATYLKAGLLPLAHIYPKVARSFREFVRRRHWLIQQQTAALNRQRGVLLQYGDLAPRGSTLSQLHAAGPHPWSADPSRQCQVTQTLAQVDLYTRQIRELDAFLLAQVKDRPDFWQLKTIPGIGDIRALTILAEVGDVPRFPTEKHFRSYCRLAPPVSRSGQTSWLRRGRKPGNPWLSWAFHQAAIHAVQSDHTVAAYYALQLQRHRGQYGQQVVYGIIARKLAQAAYHMLRDGTAYQASRLFPLNERVSLDNPLGELSAALDGDTRAVDGVQEIASTILPNDDDADLTDDRPWLDDGAIPPIDDDGTAEEDPIVTLEVDGVLYSYRERAWLETEPSTPFWETELPPDLPGVNDDIPDDLVPVSDNDPSVPLRWFLHEGMPVLAAEDELYTGTLLRPEEAWAQQLTFLTYKGTVYVPLPWIMGTDGELYPAIPRDELEGPFTWEALMRQS